MFVYCCFVCFLFILCLCQDLHDKDNRKLLLHKPTFLYENCNVSWRWLSLLYEKKYFCGVKILPFVCSVDTQWKCWKSWGNIFLVISVLVRDQTLKPGTARHRAIAILPYCYHCPYSILHLPYHISSIILNTGREFGTKNHLSSAKVAKKIKNSRVVDVVWKSYHQATSGPQIPRSGASQLFFSQSFPLSLDDVECKL